MKTTDYLKSNAYPGRLIAAGVTPQGKLVYAYAIMGRSPNSRNRIFEVKGSEVYTAPFDASKVQDPSLIIYPAILESEKGMIVCNGDQNLDIRLALEHGLGMAEGIASRTYEPDAPNYTPRISLVIEENAFVFSICRRQPSGECERSVWTYPKKSGELHMIHTYEMDGNPLPPFSGDPKALESEDDYADILWNSLDSENRISLYVKEGDEVRVFNAREEETK